MRLLLYACLQAGLYSSNLLPNYLELDLRATKVPLRSSRRKLASTQDMRDVGSKGYCLS